ncbi:AAA family ATPase [Nitratireductor aquimarinus]|uniref:AAA family ATPase n=1 Tax=Alphaproteobacteria TaxID=28211 RepID=UPI0019D3A6A0|nr:MULTISPECIES: AAA family ATPase [Alphaproteobacteria]MBN7759327.1 AAA family ATPase [Nitratireductor aquimarinus]MBY6001607.1 ATP-binding protein [Tritonibacter mobilis]MBY6023895.1 ATP-binding protein [Nitratireductor sp. DP7N14-4]
MKIERAVREKTFTLTSIAGPSGAGKTYSALLYARGLVGPDGKIGFIDTENKRSRFYADVAGGFDVIDLDPPFTSQRYIEAINAFEDAGYTAIIIDSISHEWEGSGGVLEQAEAIEERTKRSGLHCWQKPKAGHKKLMNAALQTRAHLIFCCRVKEKVVQAKGANGKSEIVNEGFVVVQEKSFIYEMTVSMMLAEGTHVPTIQKCPGDLENAFPEGRKITSDAGAAVRAWSDQGVTLDPEIENAKRAGLLAANEGMASLQSWWKDLPKPMQVKLEGMKETFKSIATASDQIKRDIHDAGGGDPGDRLAHARTFSERNGHEGGFDQSSISNQIDAMRDGSDQEHSSPAESPTGDGSGALVATNSDRSAAENSPATADEAGSQDMGESESEPASVDPDWLKTFAKAIIGAIGEDEVVVVNQSKGLFVEGLSDEVRAKAKSITNYARACCRNEIELDDCRATIAGVVGCEEKDLAA